MKLARSLGVEIYPVPLGSWFNAREIYVDKLVTPPRVQLETPFDIKLVITSAQHSRGEVILLRNGQLIAEEKVDFKRGKNVYRFVDLLDKQGLFLYKSIVHAPQDTLFQNKSPLSQLQRSRRYQLLSWVFHRITLFTTTKGI